jgi:hypothetical protein
LLVESECFIARTIENEADPGFEFHESMINVALSCCL